MIVCYGMQGVRWGNHENKSKIVITQIIIGVVISNGNADYVRGVGMTDKGVSTMKPNCDHWLICKFTEVGKCTLKKTPDCGFDCPYIRDPKLCKYGKSAREP
jgi:hypothetical protein